MAIRENTNLYFSLFIFHFSLTSVPLQIRTKVGANPISEWEIMGEKGRRKGNRELFPRQNRHVTQFKTESLLHLVESTGGEFGNAFLLNQLSEVVLVIVVETQSLEDVAESAIGCGASRGAPNLNLRAWNDA